LRVPSDGYLRRVCIDEAQKHNVVEMHQLKAGGLFEGMLLDETEVDLGKAPIWKISPAEVRFEFCGRAEAVALAKALVAALQPISETLRLVSKLPQEFRK